MTGAWPPTFTCGHHLRQLLGAAGDAFDATCIYCRVTSILAAGRALKAECRVPTEKIVGFCKRGKERGETSIVTEGARPPWENPCPRTREGEDRPARGGAAELLSGGCPRAWLQGPGRRVGHLLPPRAGAGCRDFAARLIRPHTASATHHTAKSGQTRGRGRFFLKLKT